MTKFLGNGVVTVVLSLMLTVVTLNWLINDDPEKTLLKPTLLKNSGESIESLDLSYDNRDIILNVTLNKSISCTRAIEILRIENFEVRGRVYSPTCSIVNRRLIQIKYVEIE